MPLPPGLLEAPLLDNGFPLPTDCPFTTRQALGAGLTARDLNRLVNHGLLRRLLKGVYVASQTEDSLALRSRALHLVVPDGCVITDRTAGWFLGATMILAPNDHLAVPPLSMFRLPGQGRLRNQLCCSGERAFTPEDLIEIDGIVLTSPIRTAWDIGRLLPRVHAFAGLDSMLRLEAFSREELVAGVERFRKQRGVVQLRALAPLADGRAESPGESAVRLAWLGAGDLPRPELQIPVPGPHQSTYYLDLGVEELMFGVEYDGMEWHTQPEDREHDRERRTWITQRRHWLVEVFRREDTYGPRALPEVALRRAFAEVRRTLAHRRQLR